MGMINTILGGTKYDIKVVRRKVRDSSRGEAFMDRAAVIIDEDSDEQQLKFKSDGKIVPKPSEQNITPLYEKKWYHKFLGGKKRNNFLEVVEDGDSGDFIEFNITEGSKSAERAEKDHIFKTHRNFLAKKTVDAWKVDDDNTQIWLAAYLSVLALITLGGMYMISSGIEESIVKGLESAAESGAGAGEDVTGSFIPVLTLGGLTKFKIQEMMRR